MSLHPETPVTAIAGFGPKAKKDLKTLGITTVRDLLFHIPFRYEDYSRILTLARLRVGEEATVDVTVKEITVKPTKHRHLKITEAVLEDESGTAKAIWFNQPYLVDSIPPGAKISVAGTMEFRYGRALVNPIWEPQGARIHTGRLLPVYGLSGSLAMRRVRGAVARAMSVVSQIPDWLPEEIRVAESYLSIAEALERVHVPTTMKDVYEGLRRLKFDELFLEQLLAAHVRREGLERVSASFPMNTDFLKSFVASLPFPLTNAQRVAAWEIVQDLEKTHPMNRLLEGDVGSGKTAVAAIAIAQVLEHGGSAAYLAPTEILAHQQANALHDLLKQDVALRTSSASKLNGEEMSKNELVKVIQERHVRCIVGTHALLSEGFDIPGLSFVVVDEQHRFGVEQRHRLLSRVPSPHLLSMTATPIPRSLALTTYGDLDLSILDELPAGRKPIITKMVNARSRDMLWTHVREEVGKGRQAYVVCPLIDPSDTMGAKSVTEAHAELSKGALKGLKIGLMHGKLKTDEKEETVAAFVAGKIDVLISTTVVEVGVNVPNATIMAILGAERFGLSQLHQLRGRVGRSDIQSYCYVLPDEGSEASRARLSAFVATTDGFKLAEEDLRLRGPGSMFGTNQSGFLDLQIATLDDVDLMRRAHGWARKIVDEDPKGEKYPLIHEAVLARFARVHLE